MGFKVRHVLCCSYFAMATISVGKIFLQAVLELTDGWYPMKAVVDVAMTRLVSKQRLRVGDKLVMYGAELVGSQEAAPPLQVRQ